VAEIDNRIPTPEVIVRGTVGRSALIKCRDRFAITLPRNADETNGRGTERRLPRVDVRRLRIRIYFAVSPYSLPISIRRSRIRDTRLLCTGRTTRALIVFGQSGRSTETKNPSEYRVSTARLTKLQVRICFDVGPYLITR